MQNEGCQMGRREATERQNSENSRKLWPFLGSAREVPEENSRKITGEFNCGKMSPES